MFEAALESFAWKIFALIAGFGGPGLLVMGILDSSFLFMPLGNDLLVVAFTARRHELILYYAVMASAGSVLGVLLIDLVFRKGGEEALDKHLAGKRLEYVKRKVKDNATWALALACVMPPPFPFTPFIAAASALEYPRKKLLAVVGASRMVRFSIEGVLAIYFGRGILRLAKTPAVEYAIITLIFIAVAGSIVSIFGWIRRSRRQAPAAR